MGMNRRINDIRDGVIFRNLELVNDDLIREYISTFRFTFLGIKKRYITMLTPVIHLSSSHLFYPSGYNWQLVTSLSHHVGRQLLPIPIRHCQVYCWSAGETSLAR
jgi:hypothetical protein